MRVGRVLRDASAVGRGRRPVSHSYPFLVFVGLTLLSAAFSGKQCARPAGVVGPSRTPTPPAAHSWEP